MTAIAKCVPFLLQQQWFRDWLMQVLLTAKLSSYVPYGASKDSRASPHLPDVWGIVSHSNELFHSDVLAQGLEAILASPTLTYAAQVNLRGFAEKVPHAVELKPVRKYLKRILNGKPKNLEVFEKALLSSGGSSLLRYEWVQAWFKSAIPEPTFVGYNWHVGIDIMSRFPIATLYRHRWIMETRPKVSACIHDCFRCFQAVIASNSACTLQYAENIIVQFCYSIQDAVKDVTTPLVFPELISRVTHVCKPLETVPRVATAYCQAVWSIVRHCRTGGDAPSDAIELMLRMMAEFPHNAGVHQHAVFAILCMLDMERGKGLAQAFVRHRGLESVLSTLNKYMDTKTLAGHACGVIGVIASFPDLLPTVIGIDCLKRIHNVLAKYEADEETIRQCSVALHHLAASKAGKKALAAAKTAGVLTELMKSRKATTKSIGYIQQTLERIEAVSVATWWLQLCENLTSWYLNCC